MKKLGSIPMTSAKQKVVPRSFEFNISKMLKNYFVVKTLVAKFTAAKLPHAERFFAGVVRGYDDWFESLGINQEIFDSLMVGFDVARGMTEADALFQKIKSESTESRLIVPPSYREVAAVNKGKL